MYLHKEGKIAEYDYPKTNERGVRWELNSKSPWADKFVFAPDNIRVPDWYESKEEAYKAAIDYHEEAGCKLYLELYPAPEKGDWAWVAQDCNGDWYGYELVPTQGKNSWGLGIGVLHKYKFICTSPPNPFWRKTLR
jgi:hypothetical protein